MQVMDGRHRPKNKHMTLRINPVVKGYGKKLAAREARSFNDWISQTITRLWAEQLVKDSMR